MAARRGNTRAHPTGPGTYYVVQSACDAGPRAHVSDYCLQEGCYDMLARARQASPVKSEDGLS